jgi:predicted secreted hydrolase
MRSKVLCCACALVAVSALAQYQLAGPGYHYRFPRDHFNHADYQTEWWYYTGNLKSADGHRFGFELTFFRQGVDRKSTTNKSPWVIRDLYIAHFALSDLTGQRFHHQERINRAGPGLAGVSESDKRIWNGNWQVLWTPSEQQLSAVSESFRINLSARTDKPPVIHGSGGISRKAAGAGHASHYVSFTRLLTSGTVLLDDTQFAVEGTSWMDHEFFTNQLAPDEAGWDWLSLQLSDKTELMLYRLRRKDGSVDPFSSATYVDAKGKSTHLSQAEFSVRPSTELWKSPDSKARYPISWHISVPNFGLDVNVSTALQSQEIHSSGKGTPTYWEGAIDITGHRRALPISGVGYLEMTGYAGNVQF